MGVQERFTVRNIYLYLVCLITLIIVIFGAVNLVRSTVELLYPDPNYYGFDPAAREDLSEEEIARQEKAAADSQRRQAVLGLVGSATTLLIAGPVYVYHWRRIQQELPDRGAAATAAAPPAP